MPLARFLAAATESGPVADLADDGRHDRHCSSPCKLLTKLRELCVARIVSSVTLLNKLVSA